MKFRLSVRRYHDFEYEVEADDEEKAQEAYDQMDDEHCVADFGGDIEVNGVWPVEDEGE